ncbi:protoporphyrinogen oxidase [Melghirimyces algeriensis]|uniref:Coproporphyrinogen III oxidase n=1 Tax=Melghirimyces algeriensis TaxID=910412 RepID=A0A521B8V0_9BACL|nr:protoporphyrinogen oxidase [Melghirimyces algeriensis]SMO43493.1 oxygen-dependent protoporphyrinogen oxidase [Melghirimyces algeriensis]
MKQTRVAIVGGGITGLSTAFYLQKEIERKSLPLNFVLIEGKKHLGGKIETERTDGFVMEKGPDSFLERKADAKQLAIDLGLEKELVRNQTGQAYILHQGKLLPIPEGAIMGIPTRITPFVSTPLFSWPGKFRAIKDLFMSRHQEANDISVGSFFRRRLGDEVVDHLIEPLLSGIYAGNIDQLSLQATFPQFARMEKEHRSLIIGMKRSRRSSHKSPRSQGQFLTMKRGLRRFVEQIENQLPEESIIKGNPLNRIIKERNGYLLVLSSNRVIQADAVIMTLPFERMKALLPNHQLPHPAHSGTATSVATVILGYDAEQFPDIPNGTGFVVPKRENSTITACTWTHKKWPHTVPQGKAMVRCYVGRSGDDSIVEESDETIVERVQADLKKIQGIEVTPEFTNVTRWRQSMPQYRVGHVEWLEKLNHTCRKQLPGLFYAGASFSGIGIPDCIRQGKQSVRDVLHYLEQ